MKASLLKRHHDVRSRPVSIDASCIADKTRPALIHLNADTTWLLSIPRSDVSDTTSHRSHCNILIDPWLRGRQSDVAFWFSSQWHAVKSSVQTISELNSFLEQTQEGQNGQSRDHDGQQKRRKRNYIDAVVISHEFTDHCHKPTLLEMDPGVPVFATAKAALMIKSWKHFENVVEPAPFSKEQADWRMTSSPHLPKWVGISRIVSQSDALYYHSAIMIAFNLTLGPLDRDDDNDMAEAVIYTPHGIQAQDLGCLKAANPRLQAVALMHGLHDVKISSKQLNLGAHNGLQAQRICQARYWVSTHDEVKKARGFIAPILFRKRLTLKDALEEEERTGSVGENSALGLVRNVNFADLRSGQSILLQ